MTVKIGECSAESTTQHTTAHNNSTQGNTKHYTTWRDAIQSNITRHNTTPHVSIRPCAMCEKQTVADAVPSKVCEYCHRGI